MKEILKKNLFVLISITCIVYGTIISINKYYYSSFQFVYWIFCFILVALFLTSKITLQSINKYQITALIPITILYFLSWFLIPHFMRFGVFLFSTLCFLFVGTLIYNSKSKIFKVFFVIAFAISCFNISAIFFYIAEKSIISRALINTIFISNPQETKEYLLGRISFYHLIVLVIFMLAAVLLLVKFQKKEENDVVINKRLILLFFISFGLSSFSGPFGAISSEYLIYQNSKAELKDVAETRNKYLSSNPFSVTTEKNTAKKIIVIVGESLNRNYMSLYGYSKNTTPNLLKLSTSSSSGQLFTFNNVISPEVTTVPALRKVLTNINNVNYLPFEKCISIIDVFNKAGYESYWLSNQASLGKHDTPNTIISATADHVYFTSSKTNIKSENVATGNYYDGDLLSVFEDFLSKSDKEKKQIYFIHLLGSHFNYEDRYPPEFNVFKPRKNGDENCYLNTIVYNDWVINNIIKISQINNFDVVCYFSDHGEDLINLHNQEKYTREMSTIPFMVYLSNEYIKKQPALIECLKKSKNTPAMTDNFFHDIQLITGVKSSIYNDTESFIAKSYKINKRKVVDNTIVYDK